MSSTPFGGDPGTEPGSRPGSAGERDPDSGAGATSAPAATSDEQVGVAEELFAEEEGVPATEPFPGDPVATAVGVVAKERDDYRDALQRLQADFENYKKRVVKQQEELRDRAAESLVERLLPVLDTADLALTHGGGEDVKHMAGALFTALEKEGLERIDNAGEPFDPNQHDAVAHEPGDGPTQEVAEVMRAGYRWRGRVLRAAMVKVRG